MTSSDYAIRAEVEAIGAQFKGREINEATYVFEMRRLGFDNDAIAEHLGTLTQQTEKATDAQ